MYQYALESKREIYYTDFSNLLFNKYVVYSPLCCSTVLGPENTILGQTDLVSALMEFMLSVRNKYHTNIYYKPQ